MVSLLVHAHLQANSRENRDKVLKQFGKIADHAKAHEPGVLKYAFAVPRDESNQTSIYAIEEYADQAALDTHMATEHVQTLLAMFSAAEPPLQQAPQVYQLEFTASYTRPSINSHSDPYIVVALCDLEQSKKSGLVQVWSSIVNMAQSNEPATLTYGLFRNKEKLGQIGTIEAYENEQAFENHCKTDVVLELLDAMKKVDAKVEMVILKLVLGWLSR